MSGSAAKVRFAVLGCGRMGRHHSLKMIEDGRGEVVALFDAHQSTAQQLQQDLWPDGFVCANLIDLLSRDDVDAAIICTPTAEHRIQAKTCLERGWHVLCEKPLASDRQQIVELIGMCEALKPIGRVFSLAYQRRYSSEFQTLRREVLSGRWGKVRAITSTNVENWQSTIEGTWRDDPGQNPGGFVTDAGSHKLDALFFVTGLEPVEVYARSQNWGSRVDIVTSVSALLTGDVSVTLNFVGHAQHLSEDLHLHCEHADLMLRHDKLWIARQGQLEPLSADEPASNPVTGILNMILNAAVDRSPPGAALSVFDMTQAILESSRTGAPVAVLR